ncbi:MAG: hypothetical protein ACRDQ7_01635 [Haloechinothrix sp.]
MTVSKKQPPVLELTDIGKDFGNIHALCGVSLSVRESEVTCILGDYADLWVMPTSTLMALPGGGSALTRSA